MAGLRRALIVALAMTAVVTGARAVPAGAQVRSSYIVVYRDAVGLDERISLLERLESFRTTFRYRSALHGFAAELTPAQVLRIAARPDVAFVSPDQVVRADAAVPMSPGDSAPTGVRRIEAATATSVNASSSVGVAVIDTGIDLVHPDLDVRPGVNCVAPDTPPQDDNGHGTHVAGTIGAKNDGAGLVGVVPGTTVYAVKVLDSSGSGLWSQVICGIDWVTQNTFSLAIKVANMSLAGAGANDNDCGNTNSDALHKAVCASTEAGITYAVAAGNGNADLAKSSPANYPEVLTVTAMSDSDGRSGGAGGAPTCRTGEADDTPASFSNFAVAATEIKHTIAAPGVCIASTTIPGGGPAVLSGTSMAAPHVAGSMALCLSAGGVPGPCAGMSPAEMIQKLRSDAAIRTSATPGYGFTGDPLHQPTTGRSFGHLVYEGRDFTLSSDPSSLTVPAGTPVRFDVAVTAFGAFSDSVTLTASSSPPGLSVTPTAGSTSLPYAPVSFTASSSLPGSYTVTITGAGGNVARDLVVSVSIAGPPGPPTLSAAARHASVNLTWTAPSDNFSPITGYNIYRRTMGGTETLLKKLGNVTSYRDAGLKNGTTYFYRVSAVNGVGEGPLSNERSAQPSLRCLIVCL